MVGETFAVRSGHGGNSDRGADHLPGVRLFKGRDDADRRLPALLQLRRMRRVTSAASWGLLRVLLLCGLGLSAKAARGLNPRAERPGCSSGRSASLPPLNVAPVEAEQESLHLRLRHRTLLVLLTPPVPGHAPRLVHRQRRGDEQQQKGGTGVEHGGWAPQHAEIVTGQCRLCRYAC